MVVSPMNNLLVKYPDDITISVPVRQSTDTVAAEVENMKKWADINEMSLNFTKTWEMCMHGKTSYVTIKKDKVDETTPLHSQYYCW